MQLKPSCGHMQESVLGIFMCAGENRSGSVGREQQVRGTISIGVIVLEFQMRWNRPWIWSLVGDCDKSQGHCLRGV
jgi:hypothetical protein